MLIQGETGTGKELIAKAIHNNSPRKNKPFVAMNCTALNENLLDDELFGHEPGAFTGGDSLRKGRFEHANGGTLFLDEIGDMPLTLQAKLLRVLENKEVVRIGSNEPIKVNVRVLSATNRDLEAAVAAGTFRARPVLSPEGHHDPLAAAARTARGHSAACASISSRIQQALSQARDRHRRAGAQADGGLRLAGQRPRTAQRHREHGRAGSRRRARPGRSCRRATRSAACNCPMANSCRVRPA